MTSVLSFTATTVGAEEDEEVCGLDFQGSRGFSFALMNEDGTAFRIWWHDRKSGQDECIVKFIEVVVSLGRFRASIDRAGSTFYDGPYDQIDVAFQDHDSDETSAVLAVVRRLFEQQKHLLRIEIPGLPERLP